MASKTAIAIMQQQQLDRIDAAVDVLAERFDLTIPEELRVPNRRYPDLEPIRVLRLANLVVEAAVAQPERFTTV